MFRRPIVLISAIIILIAAVTMTIGNFTTTTYTVQCKTPEEGCSYKHKGAFGKELASKTFKYEDAMQCNIETRYKEDSKNSKRDIVDTYEFFLYTDYGMDVLNFKSKDSKHLAAICSDIFEKKPFKYSFRVKKEKTEKQS